jgi:L-lactate dehydrogenase (cytochrome)
MERASSLSADILFHNLQPIHPPNAIADNLRESRVDHSVYGTQLASNCPHLPAPEKYIGPLAASSVKQVVKEITQEEKTYQERMETRPPLSQILSLHDFEAIAKQVMKPASWAYYSSGSDDEITMASPRSKAATR